MPDDAPQPIALIHSYHAHIYYDVTATRGLAEQLRTEIGARFVVQMGRWHDALVGPHTEPFYQVAFSTALFPSFVPWLMLNRRGLAVLVHPNTDHPRADHAVHAMWLGQMLPLKLEFLPEHAAEMEDSIAAVAPNTTPHLAA